MNLKLPFGLQIIRNRPELVSSGRGKLLSQLLPRWSYGRELLHEENFLSLLKGYRGWVYVCASKNSTSVASSAPIKLYATKSQALIDTGKEFKVPTRKISRRKELYLRANPVLGSMDCVRKAVEIEEILEHPFLELMKTVNDFMNSFSLWELTELWQELCGNSFWYIVEDNLKVPREIWPIPPQHCRVIPHPVDFISGYHFSLYTLGIRKLQTFREKDVIHFKFPSPVNLYYGKSPLSGVTSAYNIQENINTYENALFSNMGRLEGAFETDEELGEHEFERLKEEIKQMFAGVKNVGKSPLLEKGVTYKQYGYTPKDLAFLKGREKIKEEICNAYGQSLGMYDKNATRSNSEMAEYTFQKGAIRPRLLRIEQKINEKLIPRYDDNIFAAFDDNVPENRETRLKEIEAHLKTMYSTVNQEREHDNLEPQKDYGDVPFVPAGVMELGEEPPQPTAPPQSPITEEDVAGFSEMVMKKVGENLKERTIFDMAPAVIEGEPEERTIFDMAIVN